MWEHPTRRFRKGQIYAIADPRYNDSMIAYLEGTIIHSEKNYVILLAAGIGYKIYVTEETREKFGGSKTKLWIHSAIREDAFDLFGFPDREAIDFFQMLITVPGIGPKTALGILNLADTKTIRKAVTSGDTSYLTKVSGIGKKTADKIVLELEGKLELIGKEGETGDMSQDIDVVEALKALGYEEREARKALQKIPKEIIATGERVKAVLKILGT